MPHELSQYGDQAELMYVGDTPWHGLGTKLDNAATAAEAMQAAHLDWTVEAAPVWVNQVDGVFPNGQLVPVDGYNAIRRTDTGTVFGIMSDRYEIVQNLHAWSFLDDVLGAGGAHYHTAGALREGRVIFILAQLDGTTEIVKGDPVEKYLLLTTSHDGSLALQIHTTPIRVVCGNTHTAAMAGGRQYASIKHTSAVHLRIEQARKALAQGEAYFEDYVREARKLSRQPMNEASMRKFTQTLLGIDSRNPHKINGQTEAAERDINELFITGRGQDIAGVRGTAWAAYNAVTEYVDYRSRVQRIGDVTQGSLVAQDRRLHRSWFGRGQTIRNDAWVLLQHRGLHGDNAFDIGGSTARLARA